MPKLPADLRPGDRVLLADQAPPFTIPGAPRRPDRERPLTVRAVIARTVATAAGPVPAVRVLFTDRSEVTITDLATPVLMAGGE